MVLGTVGYMAPEQVRGHTADHRAHIFALGTVLYEMLTGQRAFRGDTAIDTMTAILLEDNSTTGKQPSSWSPDGRSLVYGSGTDLWVMPVLGDRKPAALVDAPRQQSSGRNSPDGRWFAYTSIESGSNEVYVTSFPGAVGKWQISTAGGAQARWRGDGREIFISVRRTSHGCRGERSGRGLSGEQRPGTVRR